MFASLLAAILLPIEVLGPTGTTETVAITDSVKGATYLDLRMHGLTYPNKASVKVNDGVWLPLNNENVIYPHKEAMFWGMGGPLSTLRMRVPLANWAGLNDGTNTLSFRYSDTNGLTIGFRVLGIAFDGIPVESVEQNPRDFKAPRTDPESILKGRDLWFNAPLVDGFTPIRARCADCHMQSGYDLRYFNYSPKSIIERSVFHRLSIEDSELIASYILSLPFASDNARPWNPPYQPGPGADSKPVSDWAAGEGINAVLEHDLDMIPYVLRFWPFTATLNAREVPLTIQLPDWNRWLPQVHPLDAYPEYMDTNAITTLTVYANIRSNLMKLATPYQRAVYFNKQKSNWDKYGNVPDLEQNPEDKFGVEALKRDFRHKGVAHWRVTKTFELMIEFELQEQGVALFGPLSDNRRWFHGEVFRLAPHLLGTAPWPWFYAESMQWYQAQMVLNSGNRDNASIVPIDWGYLHALNFSSWNNPVKGTTYGIALLNMRKGGEVTANGLSVNYPKGKGWDPYMTYLQGLSGVFFANQFRTIPIETRGAAIDSLLGPWLDECQRWTIMQWQGSLYYNDDFKDTLDFMIKNFPGQGANPALIERLKVFRNWLFSLPIPTGLKLETHHEE